MNKSEYARRFELLYSSLLKICGAYYSWKGLQDKSYEPIYARAKYFWGYVFLSLQDEWLLGIANSFEESRWSENNKVISVHALLAHHPDSGRVQEIRAILQKNVKTVKNISILRNHQLAHLNAEHLKNPEALLKRFPINYGEIEDLLGDFPKLLSLLTPKQDHGYILDNFVKEPEHEARYTVHKLQYYDQKEDEHFKKYAGGETDRPHFP